MLCGLRGLLLMAGPALSVTRASFNVAFRLFDRVVDDHLFHSKFLRLPADMPGGGAKFPPVMVAAFGCCALGAVMSLRSVWSRLFRRAHEIFVGLPPGAHLAMPNRRLLGRSTIPLDGRCGDRYVKSLLDKVDALVPLEAAKVAMPGPDHHPVRLLTYLPWPLSQMLEANYFKEHLIVPSSPSRVPVFGRPAAARCYSSFRSPGDRAALLVRAHQASMLGLRLPQDGDLVNGQFGVRKDADSQRLITDLRPTNSLRLVSLSEFCRQYLTLRATDPARADAQGAPASSPAALGHAGLLTLLPPGRFAKVEFDLKDYFHSWQLEPCFAEHLTLELADPVWFGLPPGPWLVPFFHTLPMGLHYAPMLAQQSHRFLLRAPNADAFFVRPGQESVQHKVLLARVIHMAVDGWVLGRDVPADLWAAQVRHLPSHLLVLPPRLPVQLRLPVSALMLEPVSVERAVADPKRHFRLRALDLFEKDSPLQYECCTSELWQGLITCVVFFVLYIDDHHAFSYVQPRLRLPASAALDTAHHLANWRLLVTIGVCHGNGLVWSAKKTVWAHTRATKTLGFETRQSLSGPASAPLVGCTAVRLHEVSTLARGFCYLKVADMVMVAAVTHLLGLFAWAALANRPFLSVTFWLYRLVAGHLPSEYVPLRRVHLDEFALMADVAYLLQSTPRRVSDVVGVFDASTAGYGCVYKHGCTRAVFSQLISLVGSERGMGISPLPITAPIEGVEADVDPSFFSEARGDAASFLSHDWTVPGQLGWKVCRSGRWRAAPSHITVGESLAGVMMLIWLLSQPTLSEGKLLVVIGDNQPMLFAFSKGRSSAFAVNQLIRQSAVLLWVRGAAVRWLWIPSAANPADQPSRMFFSPSGWIEDLTEFGCVEKHPGPMARLSRRHRDPRVLTNQRVLPATVHTYRKGVAGFARFVASGEAPTFVGISSMVIAFITWCWECGHPKSLARNCLSGLGFFFPEWKPELKGGWHAMAAWDLQQPGKSYPPLPYPHLLLCSALLAEVGDFRASWALVVGFHCYLRHSEIARLRLCDVAFEGDPRTLVKQGKAVLFLGTRSRHGKKNKRSNRTKSGRAQYVFVDDPIALAALRAATSLCSHEDDLVFGLADRGRLSLLSRFRYAQRLAGWTLPPYVVHSLRHGGCSYDFFNRIRTFDEVRLRGRWSNPKTTEIYLQQLQAAAHELRTPALSKPLLARILVSPWRSLKLHWHGWVEDLSVYN